MKVEDSPDRAALRDYLCSLIDFRDANSILDLGCGTGKDLKKMVEIAPRGDIQFIGVDRSEHSLERARAITHDDNRYKFLHHDLTSLLPFDDEYFDVVFSQNVLECIVDKDSFLREVARMLKSSGQLVFAHWDWDSQLIDGSNTELIRKIIHSYCDWKQDWMDAADGWMGRRLWKTFQRTELFEGKIKCYVLMNKKFESSYFCHKIITSFEALVRRNMIAAKEYQQFLEDIKILAKKDEFFYSITMYIFVEKKRS